MPLLNPSTVLSRDHMGSGTRGSARPSTSGALRPRFGNVNGAPPKPRPKPTAETASGQSRLQGAAARSATPPFPVLVGSAAFHMRDSAELRRQSPSVHRANTAATEQRPSTADGRIMKGSPHKASSGGKGRNDRAQSNSEALDIVLTGRQLVSGSPSKSPTAGTGVKYRLAAESEMCQLNPEDLSREEEEEAEREEAAEEEGMEEQWDDDEEEGEPAAPSNECDMVTAGSSGAASQSHSEARPERSSVSSGDAVNLSYRDGGSDRDWTEEDEEPGARDLSDPGTVEPLSNSPRAEVVPGPARCGGESEREGAAAFRHKGTLAARAQMGRRRVLGAVRIQRWFRALLHHQELAERARVREMMQDKRGRLRDEQGKRERDKLEEERMRREAAEERTRAEERRREEEVELARARLKEKVEQSLPSLRTLAGSSSRLVGGKGRTAAAKGKANGAGPDGVVADAEQTDDSKRSAESDADAEAREEGAGGEGGSLQSELRHLSNVLRLSAERSVEAVTRLLQADDDDDEDSARAEDMEGGEERGRLSDLGASAAAREEADAARRGWGDEEAPQRQPHFPSDPPSPARAASHVTCHVTSPPTLSCSAPEAQAAAASPSKLRSPGAGSRLSPVGGDERFQSPTPETVRKQQHKASEDLHRMDREARELQSSILSFLDAAESDVHSSVAGSDAVSEEAADRSVASEASRTTAALSERSTAVPSPRPSPSARPPLPASLPASPSLSHTAQPTLASQVYSEVKAKMASLKVDLDQRDKTIKELKSALSRAKKEANAADEEHRKDTASQLAVQRAEYEAKVKRNLEFVDQLVSDKMALSAKCEDLAAEFNLLQRRFEGKLKEAEDRHQRDLKKQKESILVAEKIRRENWMRDKSKEIKEMTVKGLQPEVERMMEKHKTELTRIEDANNDELRRQREMLTEAHERAINELRDRMLLERERAVERERELASVRLREQSERFDQQLQAQRVRLAEDMAKERERMEGMHRAERQRIEDMYGMQVMDDSRKLASVQREWAEKEEELQRRHATEMSKQREQLEVEKEQWRLQVGEAMEREKKEAMLKTKEELEKQRDEEIEVVICRLEEEAEATRVRLKEDADDKVARAKEQALSQVQSAKEEERRVMDKYLLLFKEHSSADERLRAQGERVLELEAELSRKAQAVEAAEREAAKWRAEAGRRETALQGEHQAAQLQTQAHLAHLKEQLRDAELRSKEARGAHEHELRELNRRKMEELDAINSRVRATVARKDDAIAALQKQVQPEHHQLVVEVAEGESRVRQYEELLDKQRQELLA